MLRHRVSAWVGRVRACIAAVRRLGAVRFRRLPRLRQHDVTDCGAACLAAVAAFYGRHVSIARARQFAGTDQHGTTVLGLIDAAARLGFAARGVRGPVECLSRIPLPAVAHVLAANRAHHYVVIYRVGPRRLWVMDPADGRVRRELHAEFARRWTGVLLLLAPNERFEPGGAHPSVGRRLWALVRPHRRELAQALLGALAYTLLGLATSVYVQKLVDHVLVDGNRNLLNLMSVVMVALLLVQAYLGAGKGLLVLHTAQRIDAEVVTGYYAHLVRLPQRVFDTMRIGELTSRVGDAVKIRAFVNDVALDIVVSALVVALSLGLMTVYSPTLAAVTAAAAPAYGAVYWVTDRVNRRSQRTLMERAAELESHLVESIAAVSTIKRFGLEWFAALRTETRFVRLLRAARRSAAAGVWSATGAELASRLATVTLLWVGAGLVLDRAMSPGELMSCYALLGYLTGPVTRLIGMNRSVRDALIAADRLFEIMELEREDAAPALAITREMAGDIRFDHVSFRYGGRTRVLADVTVDIRRGTLTAIVGESGSGKSTLAAILYRAYPIDGGRVLIGEHDLHHLSVDSVRRLVGVVPQRVDLFAGTLLENIALGELEPDMRRVLDGCRRLGMADFVAALPNGFLSQIGEHGTALSGGQKQRVALARALYRDPEILILDEATAALDSVAEQDVQRVVRELVRDGKTVIVIAHRLSTVVHADRIVVLDGGRVAEQGTHTELIRRGGAYARLWSYQFGTAVPDSAVA